MRTQCALRAGLEMWEQDGAQKREREKKNNQPTKTTQYSDKKSTDDNQVLLPGSRHTSCFVIIMRLCAPHPTKDSEQNAK